VGAREKKREKKKKKKDEGKPPGATKMKEEIARELGLEDEIAEKGWGNLSSRDTGRIGGIIAGKLKQKNKN